MFDAVCNSHTLNFKYSTYNFGSQDSIVGIVTGLILV
jgi:hypothetical protein